jgi:hypothetical protein
MADDIWTLSPAEAAAKLQTMKTGGAPAPGLAKPVNIPALSAQQAAARLDELSRDEKWTERLLNGGVREQKELSALTEKKTAPADLKLETVFAHGVDAAPIFETTSGDELSTWKLGKVVADLRDDGLADDHIRELFAGEPISKELHDAARRLQQERFTDPEYVERYLKGGAVEKREQY